MSLSFGSAAADHYRLTQVKPQTNQSQIMVHLSCNRVAFRLQIHSFLASKDRRPCAVPDTIQNYFRGLPNTQKATGGLNRERLCI